MSKNHQMYFCKTISDIEELIEVPSISIDHYQWSKEYRPEAHAQMAYLDSYGLIIRLVAYEKNPLRRYKVENDPVYKDSALEFFVSFPPYKNRYMNFEVNALGTLLSGFGYDGQKRPLSEITKYKVEIKTEILENYWTVLMKIPLELISDVFKITSLKSGDDFKCNFYKISEDKSIEHYASWSEITSDLPNFHLIDFFGKAIIS